jgi:hypothetical protein
MKGPGAPTGRAALRAGWRQWTAIVEAFARRRPARRRVSPQAYARLHQGLLAACRSLAETATEADKSYYQGLESLAGPWLTAEVLARTDRQLLGDLWLRCRQVQRELGGGPGFPAVWRWAVSVLLLGALAAAVPFAQLMGWVRLPTLGQIRDWSEDVWFAVKHLSPLHWLVLGTVVAILTGTFLISRTAKH